MAMIDTLRLELANDPEGLGYTDKSDPEAADLINAQNRTVRGTVRASEVRRFVLLNGIWPKIAASARATPMRPFRERLLPSCKLLRQILLTKFGWVTLKYLVRLLKCLGLSCPLAS